MRQTNEEVFCYALSDLPTNSQRNMSKALRRQDRIPCRTKIRVFWEENDRRTIDRHGMTTDISTSGLALELDQEMSPRTYVHFEIPVMKFRGVGSIRFVSRQGLKFAAGLEFAGGLTWDPDRYPLPAN